MSLQLQAGKTKLSLAMNKLKSFVTLFLGCLLVNQVVAANRLEKIETLDLPGDQVQIRLELSESAPQPLSFTVDNPARIALDLPDTGIALPSRHIEVKHGVVETINVATANDRTRVVLNLSQLVPYQTHLEGKTLTLTVGKNVSTISTTVNEATSDQSEVLGRVVMDKVDFGRGRDGAGRVSVKFNSNKIVPSVQREGGQLVVKFANTLVADELLRKLNVDDFATPVSMIETVRDTGGAHLLITANGEWEPVAYQSDNLYTLEIRPVTQAASSQAKNRYKGEKISLNFQDIEVRAVLQLLADTSGQNLVISDSVHGNVTLTLQNVPWDQALDIVMQAKGLDMRQEGNVLVIAPAAEIAAREKELAAAKQDLVKVAPLQTEYLQINYAKASDLAALIKGKGNSLMSERGNISVDERTNTLLLQDTTENLINIRKLVTTLDVPVRQVLIEARIVVVNDDFSRELGAKLGVTGSKRNGTDGVIAVSGTAAGTDTMISSALTNLNSNGTPYPMTLPSGTTAANRYMVNLPASKSASSFALGFLTSNYLLDLELSAAQSEGRGEIVSSPKLITSNQKEASIEQGVEIPYQQSASSGATTISFKKATLSLKVTPQITPDDQVILSMAVTKDSVGQVVVASGGINVPSIDTRQINTQVLVNDGHTVVLGGILETELRDSETKVPLLGDIPILGHLFKSSSKTRNKAELLIFVTPKILKEGAQLN